ncbi:MAG: hypothetical protein KAI90_05695, partial [Desulfobulbaceae bacterium]|nr:hypothetical protein [Desulfobulbaceae bacterium]
AVAPFLFLTLHLEPCLLNYFSFPKSVFKKLDNSVGVNSIVTVNWPNPDKPEFFKGPGLFSVPP